MRKTIKAGICLVALMALIVCAGCGAQGENGASSNVSPDKVDIDLTELSSTMVYSEVYNMMNTPDDYVGKTVKMKGTAASFYDDKEKENYYACIIKDATACCSQGLEYTLPDNNYPEDGEEITVVGEFQTYKTQDGSPYCTLKDAIML